LVLQASADQKQLSNTYQATLSINANCPVCACPGGSSGTGATSGFPGGFGGSGGATGGTGVGSGGAGGGGNMGMGDGGTQSAAAPGQSSFGCSTSSADPPGVGLFASLASLVGLALFRARARKKR
jgi:MYXO-CTERM domain-containing protein